MAEQASQMKPTVSFRPPDPTKLQLLAPLFIDRASTPRDFEPHHVRAPLPDSTVNEMMGLLS